MGGRSMKDVGGAVLAGSTPPFLGRERAAVDVDVGPVMMMSITIWVPHFTKKKMVEED